MSSSQNGSPANKLEEQARKGYSYFANNSPQDAVPAAAPRKLTEEEAAAQQEAEKQLRGQGSSAWNHAGTFEERDWSEWAKGRLQELCKGSTFQAGSTQVCINSVTVDKGHANSWFVRGKKRHGFDFELTLSWACTIGSATINGTARIPNAASDELDDMSLIDVQGTDSKPEDKAANAAACKAVQSDTTAHMSSLLEKLLEELKQK